MNIYKYNINLLWNNLLQRFYSVKLTMSAPVWSKKDSAKKSGKAEPDIMVEV